MKHSLKDLWLTPLLVVLLALTSCVGSSTSMEDSWSTATAEVMRSEAYTATPTSTEPPPTIPKPTATFVPLITPSPTVDGPTKADVPRIGVAAAKAKVEAGEAILVDVRTEATYGGSHIPGAISMPADQVARRYAELASEKLIIFYCA